MTSLYRFLLSVLISPAFLTGDVQSSTENKIEVVLLYGK